MALQGESRQCRVEIGTWKTGKWEIEPPTKPRVHREMATPETTASHRQTVTTVRVLTISGCLTLLCPVTCGGYPFDLAIS